ncbi:MAG TPA: PAS domain-containing sensor histidine kinase [Candidatus Sulfotelmatobacter sp.]|jgi:two-component system nitrogen regulation sensor histidine kinase NtrY|nr:PAS domain-containing sensor histidine kinase [Candidatus Sulfotelmatobacter sp.]
MSERHDRTRMFLRFRLWSRRVNLSRKLAVALALAIVASGVATYAALTNSGPLGGPSNPQLVLGLLVLDMVLMLFVAVLVARHIARIWAERKSGAAGAKLHVRITLMFSVVAITPAILVAVFSTLLINFGVEQWFNSRVSTAVDESLAVAKAYLEEHQQAIGGDALAMAADINREGPGILSNPIRLEQMVGNQAGIRALSEAIVFNSTGEVIARSGLAFSMELSIQRIPRWAFDQVRSPGQVAVLTNPGDDRVRALVKLDGSLVDTYLYVGRFVDPKVLDHLSRTTQAVAEYQKLEGTRNHLEITFSAIFVVVALLLLLAAVWVGLSLASQLASPIVALIDAAERIRAGDLTARVDADAASDELRSLSRAFNRMTSQLGTQRRDLMAVNTELDERRRFTEAVLAGVSAGVIGLDINGAIELPNRSAVELLAQEPADLIGNPLGEAVPEMSELLEAAKRRPDRSVQDEMKLHRAGRNRTLLVRISAESDAEGQVAGYVVTFDDITELASAQRKAAWADVARRIAHEIKNPLTPIQLSAERLKRKYLKEITSDPETFVTCTDTIIRQVGDIGRMVDEFSSFARMPAPVIKTENLSEIVRQAVFLARNGYPKVTFNADMPPEPLPISCDGRLIGQAMTNLLKNAVEAIEGREGAGLPPGEISVVVLRRDNETDVVIEDNGKGLPAEQRDRLTEPYVTTRAKGTGLGLAIVKKIMEDHGGELSLEDRDAEGTGARVRLIFRPSEMVPDSAAEGAGEHHGA